MNRIVHGVVHGNTIEMSEHLGLRDGQPVEVVVNVLNPSRAWGEGIRNSAGGLADQWTEEDDQILQQIYQDRQQDARRDIAE